MTSLIPHCSRWVIDSENLNINTYMYIYEEEEEEEEEEGNIICLVENACLVENMPPSNGEVKKEVVEIKYNSYHASPINNFCLG